jgi:PEP-CTERM motif
LWNYNALAIDLNTLIDPSSGWTLLQAYGISDTNIAVGVGSFDPDGAGPLASYGRAFLLDVSSVVSAPGDFNNDHKVDAADYVIWRKTNGTQVGYDAWRTNFGATSGSGAGSVSSQTAVPEPSTFVSAALSLAAAGLFLSKRRT